MAKRVNDIRLHPSGSNEGREDFIGFRNCFADDDDDDDDDEGINKKQKVEEEKEDSDVDDYLSEAFVVQAESVRPGMSSSRNYRREIINNQKREKNESEHVKQMPKHEREKVKLEEGLQKPLDPSSKGFSLMARMGYKPGMSLGKKKDENDMGSGIKEPVPLLLKQNREGLGIMAERKARFQKEIEKMRSASKNIGESIEDYRKRKHEGYLSRNWIKDLKKFQTVCQNLDAQRDLSSPLVPWFWKSFPKEVKNEESYESEIKYFYRNGKEGPPTLEYELLSLDEMKTMYDEINEYLRQTYFYCMWCCMAYEEEELLKSHCPGTEREAHPDYEDD
ncbi:unnamed protein product [Auanema sp. JU1783]|nr:unnamed protein product [Auanema sp. JU1783]